MFFKTRTNQKGQALVESAIVMPLMIFIILGIVQIVMIQHAKIMTEYAAFNATRAGIVWNGDQYVMENAAIISLLPTYEKISQGSFIDPQRMLSQIAQRALLYQVNRNVSDWLGEMLSGVLSDAIRAVFAGSDRKVVEVEILHPLRGDFEGATELDFDDLGNDRKARRLREANRLTIRVRYLYLMKIPFANWIIHQAWLARRAGQDLYGAVWNPQLNAPGETGFSSENDKQLSYSNLGTLLNDPLMRDLTKLGDMGVYMIPLEATYTMRMQSNLFKMYF